MAIINGDSTDNILVGTPDADTINGGGGENYLYGGGGNDTFILEGTTDYISGGDGIDTAVIDYSTIANSTSLLSLRLFGDSVYQGAIQGYTNEYLQNRFSGFSSFTDYNNPILDSGGNPVLDEFDQNTYPTVQGSIERIQFTGGHFTSDVTPMEPGDNIYVTFSGEGTLRYDPTDPNADPATGDVPNPDVNYTAGSINIDGGIGLGLDRLSLTIDSPGMAKDLNLAITDTGNGSSIMTSDWGSYSNFERIYIRNNSGGTSHITGGNYYDNISTGGGDDVVRGNGGDDVIRGGGGRDVAVYSGNFAEYLIATDGTGISVSDSIAARDGTDFLDNVELLRFANGILDLVQGTFNPIATNTPPTTSAVTLVAIGEDSGIRTISQSVLLANASDVDGNALTAADLVIASGGGSLSVSTTVAGAWEYSPALNDDSEVTFAYSISDGQVSIPATAVLDITSVNDGPTWSSPGFFNTQEQTPVSLHPDTAGVNVPYSFTDIDAGNSMVELTVSVRNDLSNLQTGTLSASSGSTGVTFDQATTDKNIVVRGTISQLEDFMNGVGASEITFTPVGDDVPQHVQGTTNGIALLTMKLDDLGNSGAGGAKSTTVGISINVAPVEDDLVNQFPVGYATAEDAAVPLAGLSVFDPDLVAGQVRVQLQTDNGTGTLTAVSAAGVAVTSLNPTNLILIGQLADINAYLANTNTQPMFTPSANLNGQLALQMTSTDLGLPNVKLISSVVPISITPVNDAATVAGNTTGIVLEDISLQTVGTMVISDPDGASEAVLNLSVALGQLQKTIVGQYGQLQVTPAGAWTYTLNNANPAVQLLGNADSVQDTFVLKTIDGTDASVTITINGNNEKIDGTNGNNTLTGTAGGDTISGLGGNDILTGAAGNDFIDGGTGIDRANFADPVTTATFSLSGTDLVVATPTDGVDTLRSIEVLRFGNQTFTSGQTLWRGTAASETLNGSGNADLILGLGGTDILNGNAGGDFIFGEGSTDRLNGANGNDFLSGGSGGDFLTGGNGSDTLVGGAGTDVFIFNAIAETAVGANHDVIVDFTAGDRIDVSAIDANLTKGGNDSFAFVGMAAFNDSTTGAILNVGQIRYQQVDTDGVGGFDSTLVQGNTNNNLAPDFEVLLKGYLGVLVPTDFVL
jgi:VCBS repeat-containing protein